MTTEYCLQDALSLCCSGVSPQDIYLLEVIRGFFFPPLSGKIVAKATHSSTCFIWRRHRGSYSGAHDDWYSHLLSELYNILRLVTGGSMNEEKHIYCSLFCARLVLVLETWLGLRNIFNIY